MSSDDVEVLKQIKKTCRTRLTKFKTFLERYVGIQNKDSVSIEEFRVRLSKVEGVWDEFDKAHTTLELKFPAQDLENERTEFEEYYYKYVSLGSKFLNQRTSQVSGSEQTRSDAQSERIAQLESQIIAKREAELTSLREMASSRGTMINERSRNLFPLPKLELPTFSGAYDEWLVFRDAFTAVIHDDESIPAVQKLRYLCSFVKNDGARIIENLETTENNYDVAWNLLTDRFNNSRIICKLFLTCRGSQETRPRV